ncbi:MAG TPA: 30S ribosomal protein S3, partial [Bacteroidales bacterium]|nr:30S ribosomal protein S3 [Bacteroidales bacterium]
NNVARDLERRISYRRAIKMAISNTMRIGAEGIKIQISGRLGGAEIARREMFKEGRIPLHTLRADIDYARDEAHTTYGRIGIKVWICRGEIYGRPDFFATSSATRQQRSPVPGTSRPRSRGKRK